MENTEEIAYQNKDIASKVLAENFKGKSFHVYGLELPEVTQVLPTNIPVVKANELRLDNLFQLADDTVAIVDYESEYKTANKVKYLNYIIGIANRYLKEKAKCPRLRMIVIYTGNIARAEVSDSYDIGAVKLNVESAFLSELDSQGIAVRLKEKVERGEPLTDDEMMEFIIFPLSYKNIEEQAARIDEAVDLAIKIKDRSQQVFVLSGILVFTDKIITHEAAGKIRRAIEMTKIGQIIEEEKQAYGKQMAKQAAEQATEQAKEDVKKTVMNLLRANMPAEEVANMVYGITLNEVKELEEKMLQTV